MARENRSDPKASNLVGVRVLDLHLPVVSGEARASGGLSVAKSIVYSTAFPVLPGLFVTAAHMIEDAKVDGKLGLGWMTPDREIKVFPIVDCEVFFHVDLALCHCPDLVDLVTIPLDFDNQLDMLTPAYAIGFPHAVDPE